MFRLEDASLDSWSDVADSFTQLVPHTKTLSSGLLDQIVGPICQLCVTRLDERHRLIHGLIKNAVMRSDLA